MNQFSDWAERFRGSNDSKEIRRRALCIPARLANLNSLPVNTALKMRRLPVKKS